MKRFTSSITVRHLNQPVLVQVARKTKIRNLLSRKTFLTMMAIARFEELGAFNSPGIYLIVIEKYGEYELFKYDLPEKKQDDVQAA